MLLLETDHSYKAARTVVNKIIRNEALSDGETQILRDLDIWYVYFDNFGVHTTRGGDTLIGRFMEEMNTSDVIPLGFTVNRFSDQSVSDVEIAFDLP